MLEDYTVIDLEMTGLCVKRDVILEVGAVRVRGGVLADTYSALLFTEKKLPPEVAALTGITQEMLQAARDPEQVMEEFFAFVGEDVLIGQNVIFDYSFLKQWAVNHGALFERSAVDTLKLARRFLPPEQKKDLESLCVYFQVERGQAHRALDDAIETFHIFEKLKARFGEADADVFVPRPLCYQTKKQTPATGRQLEYLKKYAAYYQIELPQSLAGLTRSEASRLTDQLIARYGKMPKTREAQLH